MLNAKVRRISKLLFGSRYRLEVADAIATKKRCYAKQIAATLGINDNLVLLELNHLEEAGLVEREPRFAREPQYYYRVSHPYWKMAAQVLAAFRKK